MFDVMFSIPLQTIDVENIKETLSSGVCSNRAYSPGKDKLDGKHQSRDDNEGHKKITFNTKTRTTTTKYPDQKRKRKFCVAPRKNDLVAIALRVRVQDAIFFGANPAGGKNTHPNVWR